MLTDKEIIQKIQYLRVIGPNENWVNSLHQTLKKEMRKTAKKQSFDVSITEAILGRILRPVPIFAASGVLGIIAIFAIIGISPKGANNPGITENGQIEDQTSLVQDNGGNAQGGNVSKGEGFSVVAQEDGEGSSIRTIVLQDGDGEFKQDLFNKVSEKLKKAEEMVREISTVADVRASQELLDKAKEALSNGNLVDAFDVLVALERLLER